MNKTDWAGVHSIWTTRYAPGAAKFLLTHSDKTNPDILRNDGRSVLAMVRSGVAEVYLKKGFSRVEPIS
jgi:hypothetical protein